jgi:hypothetical protein
MCQKLNCKYFIIKVPSGEKIKGYRKRNENALFLAREYLCQQGVSYLYKSILKPSIIIGVVTGNNYLSNIVICLVLYSALIHLPSLRFHCVGGCWNQTQESCDFDFGFPTL